VAVDVWVVVPVDLVVLEHLFERRDLVARVDLREACDEQQREQDSDDLVGIDAGVSVEPGHVLRLIECGSLTKPQTLAAGDDRQGKGRVAPALRALGS
jgi:hypothetical protein